MKRFLYILLVSAATLFCGAATVRAQHTLGVFGGYGSASARFYPAQETRMVFGRYNFGLSWRYYSLPRFVGAVGADLELLQRGFSYGYTYTTSMNEDGEEEREYSFYTRRFNSIMLPLVWQPHVYMARNHIRLYLEAAVTFSYNFSGDYTYEDTGATGRYDMRSERDNRFGYGLAGGGGLALIFGRYEMGFRARYYFGYSDILRNMNRYYDNATDGAENPFARTPLKSPIDNLAFSVTLAYRFNKEGFTSWSYKPRRREKMKKEFRFSQKGDMVNMDAMRR